ncbi:hypothetical protein [Sorangium sp. So ce1099]|uniref:hypothetical protein n=1 Tax=Sorangium sp. So ce1099 TaxID=3133331 RepID=UPI003F601E1D
MKRLTRSGVASVLGRAPALDPCASAAALVYLVWMRILSWMTLGLLCAACGDTGDPPGPGGGGSGGVGATTVSSGGGDGGSGGSGGNGGSGGSGGSGGTGVGGDGAGGSAGGDEGFAAPAATFLHPAATPTSRVVNTAIAAAPDGGAYVGGEGRGAVMLGDQTITERGAFLIHLDRDGAPRWSAPIVTARQSAATAVTVDGSGNVLLAGEFKGYVTIGSTTLAASQTYLDVMVAKLDGEGAVLWAKRFGSVADDRSVAIATDATDHVYVGGNVFWEVDFGSGLLLAHGQSPFLLKLTPDGDVAWAKVFNSPGGNHGAVAGIATHDDGDVSITGYADRPLPIDGTELSMPAGSAMMGFIARFSSAGEIRFARRFGGPELDMGNEISVGEGTFLAGTVSGESDVLGTTVNADVAGTPFVAKLTESGTAEWVITPEPGGAMYGLAPDMAGGVYAAGRHAEGADGQYSPFLLHAGASSEVTAARRYASSAGSADGVARTSDGALWVAGVFEGSIDLGTGPVESPSTSGFILRFPPP